MSRWTIRPARLSDRSAITRHRFPGGTPGAAADAYSLWLASAMPRERYLG